MKDAEWQRLARALRDLHRALVERARTDYLRDNEIGGDISPSELLRLLTTDPYFAWLRGLSEMMVDIDSIRDLEESKQDPAGVRAAVERFITPTKDSEAPDAFAQRYWPYLHDDPQVAMAHADVKRALAGWPEGKKAG